MTTSDSSDCLNAPHAGKLAVAVLPSRDLGGHSRRLKDKVDKTVTAQQFRSTNMHPSTCGMKPQRSGISSQAAGLAASSSRLVVRQY